MQCAAKILTEVYSYIEDYSTIPWDMSNSTKWAKDMQSWSWLTGRWRMRWYPKNSRIASMRNWRWKQRLKQTWYEGSCKWNRPNLCQQAEPYKRWNEGMWGVQDQANLLEQSICAAAEWASEFWIHVGSSTRRTSGAAAKIAEIGCHYIYQFVRSGRSCDDWAKIFGCTCCILGRCQGSLTIAITFTFDYKILQNHKQFLWW